MLLRTTRSRFQPREYFTKRGYASSSFRSVLKRKTKRGTSDITSRDHILHKDIGSFLGNENLTLEQVRLPEHLIHKFLFEKERKQVQIENVTVVSISSEGDGLGLVSRNAYDDKCTDPDAKTVVKLPKTVPGDLAKVLLKRHHDYYAEAELISVAKTANKSSHRNDKLVLCEHFDLCSGCQLQMIPYEDQLEFKLKIIQRAYKYYYPDLDCSQIEGFGLVIDSPMQFAYRTKLTPHTFVPRNLTVDSLPVPVGFNNAVHGKPIVNIRHCSIATSPINAMIPKVKQEFNKSLVAKLESNSKVRVPLDFILRDSLKINHATGEHANVCLTKRNNVTTEKVKDFVFQFEANEFFQNNRSILPTFIDFISYHLSEVNFEHIVDAYCGSGFLGISLSKQLSKDGKVFGIEISKRSIKYAKHNAGINGIPMPEKMIFVTGNSDSMFTNEEFLRSGVSGENSAVLMNPSRKGSTNEFIKQLMDFRPKAIIYVSCNVFTQARDLATLQTFADRSDVKYRIKAITGFDFYPQTKHVESIAILELQESC